ncbi:MAG: 4'-phosphopantetheinyl transferase family protein [Solitalea-like symbiont of Acarus siro]
MPIIQVHKLKYCCIYIWHIKESLGELIEIANRYNLDNFDNITHNGRLKQFIAARVTLAKGLNLDHIPKLTKTLSGKPIFKELSMFFSISHCGDLVAVAISQYEIGIDIQTISKKFT